MRTASQWLLLFFAFLIAGCVPESDNDLPARSLHEDARIVGDFYVTSEAGRRSDVRIEKIHNKKGHYAVVDPTENKEEFRFRLFKIGDTEFISVRKDEGVDGYMFGRLTVSRTQLVVEMLDEKWMIANSEAIPGTRIIEDRTLKLKKAQLKASSDKIEQFFRTNADSTFVFDVANPILLNRAGT